MKQWLRTWWSELDVAGEPPRSRAATPTVIRRSPRPERQVIGDLWATGQVLKGLYICRPGDPAPEPVELTNRDETPEVHRG